MLVQANAEDSTPASRDAAEDYLIEKIKDVRAVLATKNYKKTLPVGTADAGSQMSAKLAAACDFVSVPFPPANHPCPLAPSSLAALFADVDLRPIF